MVKTLISSLLLLLMISGGVRAQDRTPVELKNHQYYFTLLDPGVAWEKKLNDNQSLYANFGITGLGGRSTFDDEDFGISLNPYLNADFRNFYARKRVKKDLNPNSGNYVALRAGYNFGAITDNVDFGTTEVSRSFFIGPVWGIQRNYLSGIHLGLSLGAGAVTGKHTDLGFTLLSQFQLGFAIGK